jgi:TonB family protein
VDPINVPTMPAALSVDSILRAASEKQRASDSDRARMKDQVSVLPATMDVGRPHTSPKIVGRAPDPGFPDVLLRSGPREGLVVVRFMVDEFGRVDVASMTVERSDNDAFTDAVRDVLPKFRFEPAHTLGPDSKAVPAWVSVPFRFTTKKR